MKQVASDNTALVDIGSAVGIVRDANLARLGETILVQVERQYPGSKVPELSTEIKIPGRHAILLPGRQVKISKRILDSGTRERLRVLGDELANQKWGILWRTSAANALDSALREEVQALTKAGEQVLEKAEVVEAPAMLFEGLGFADVELPALSKRKLDDIRKQVNATIPGHHFYKACGDRVSAALDMAERMIEKGSLQSEVEELFKQTVEQEYPIAGEWVEMEHAKLAGQVLHLGLALLESYSSETLMFELRRVFKRVGVYDGLAVPKEPDDYAVTKGLVGDWLLKTQYFSKDGELKGSYININTPIELYPYGIRYVDLEADICLWPDGRLEVLDLERLEEALKKGVVTERLVGIAKAKLAEVTKEIRSDMAWE